MKVTLPSARIGSGGYYTLSECTFDEFTTLRCALIWAAESSVTDDQYHALKRLYHDLGGRNWSATE